MYVIRPKQFCEGPGSSGPGIAEQASHYDNLRRSRRAIAGNYVIVHETPVRLRRVVARKETWQQMGHKGILVSGEKENNVRNEAKGFAIKG